MRASSVQRRKPKAPTRTFFVLMAKAPSFAILGKFPAAVVGIPYDHELEIAGAYVPPVTVDVLSGYVPAGLTLEVSVDGQHARLHGTPLPGIEFAGILPGCVIGQPYSARLQVTGLGSATLMSADSDSLPAWMTVTVHSGTNEIEFSGTPA